MSLPPLTPEQLERVEIFEKKYLDKDRCVRSEIYRELKEKCSEFFYSIMEGTQLRLLIELKENTVDIETAWSKIQPVLISPPLSIIDCKREDFEFDYVDPSTIKFHFCHCHSRPSYRLSHIDS